MKILHIIAGAERGGAESCAVDTIKALDSAGIEQTLICRPHPAFLTLVNESAINHHILSFNRAQKWLEKATINEIVEKEKLPHPIMDTNLLLFIGLRFLVNFRLIIRFLL